MMLYMCIKAHYTSELHCVTCICIHVYLTYTHFLEILVSCENGQMGTMSFHIPPKMLIPHISGRMETRVLVFSWDI